MVYVLVLLRRANYMSPISGPGTVRKPDSLKASIYLRNIANVCHLGVNHMPDFHHQFTHSQLSNPKVVGNSPVAAWGKPASRQFEPLFWTCKGVALC